MFLPTMTIAEVVSRLGAIENDSPALIASGLAPLSFGGLGRLIRQVGAQLQAAGLGPQSRVGIALPRGPEAALLSIAVCCSTTLLPLNPTLNPGELASELEDIRLDALIVPGWMAIPAWASTAHGTFGLFQVSEATSSFDTIALTQVRPVARRALKPGTMNGQSIAAIFRTSGTTGAAKRVPVTHENLLEMANKMQRWLKLSPADRSACVMPIYYNAGFKATLVVPLLIGCSVALPAAAGPQDFERWVSELRPTWLTAAPAYLQSILDKLRSLPAGEPEHSLRFVLSTASYLPDAVRTELAPRLGVPVLEFYGLCEAGMMTAPTLPPAVAKPGTVGSIPPGELAIRGDDGTLLPPGKVGQIVLRGRSVMPGYLYDIDDVPSGLVDGWLATGDLGVVDADGILTVVGRTKEIINRGGEKVSPYDVEKMLLLHPAVREAAAFAVPHPRLGENVAAAVVLNDGMKETSSALIGFLRDRLAPFQMPRHIHFLAALPRGPTGKISRSTLSADFAREVREVVPANEPLQIQISEVWARILDRTDFGIDDDFFEAGGDSLQATEMLLELEAITRQAIAPSDIKAELTIRHLALTLANAAAAKDELVTKVKDGSGRPLFICHGDFDGWGIYALRLAELIKDEGPIYLLHPNLDKAAGIGTIEAMAGSYVPYLLAAQPEGKFRLAGYCNGGLAAWEIAHQLEAAGREVEQIVLVDTFSINARPAVRRIARAVGALSEIAPKRVGERVRTQGMPAVWSGTRRLMQKDRTVLWRVAKRLYRGTTATGTSQRTAYYRAMSHYLPPRIGSRVVCLLSDEYSKRTEFSATAWKGLAPRVDYEQVPGAHNTCITSHVDDLAGTLNRHLSPAKPL